MELLNKTSRRMENICRWEKVQKKLAEYATDESDDEGLIAHVTSQADYLFKHMRDVWQMVLNMQK